MSDYRVLIVEDELLVAADIEESLQMLGYKVIGAVATGKDAIESVERQLPDIILMDIMLKGNMTGIDAANIIRRQHDVPIIYLTANADLSTIEKAKVSLPYGYIVKPFTDKDLQTNIEIARFKFNNDLKQKMESDQFNSFFKAGNTGQDNTIIVDGESGLEKINYDDIYYLEATEDKTLIHLADETIKTNLPLEKVAAKLNPDSFIQANKTQIVNSEKIFMASFPELIIADKMEVIIIDDDKREAVKSRIQE
jgi:two-component system, LytTR family, response regulator LytT